MNMHHTRCNVLSDSWMMFSIAVYHAKSLIFALLVVLSLLIAGIAWAGSATQHFPKDVMLSDRSLDSPVANAAFVPAGDAEKADPLHAIITIQQTDLVLNRELSQPVCDGREVEIGGSCHGGTDKRIFPTISLEFFSFDDNARLGSAQVGTIIPENSTGSDRESYWRVIPQYGRVWKEPGDGDWSRAAFPIMLVHDVENVAHQGLATFLYKDNHVSAVRMQFVQQSTPWNTPEHFIAWAVAESGLQNVVDPTGLAERQAAATSEISRRVEVRPWSELVDQYPPGALNGFGGPLNDKWIAMNAAVKDGIVYLRDPETPYGPFPYPQDMRFGVRSMTKSITAPLALARLSQVFGPYVLNLKIGDYVDGLHPGYDDVRFIDAANMATGMGGAGSLTTNPNDGDSGYLYAYDDWYNEARSAAEKVEYITRDLGPYPWGPGVVYRYRDQSFHLLGMAADGFLKAVRGPKATIWDMLEEEVFRPIGIYHAPIVRTIEPDGTWGLPWFHAGFYPTLDDIAKIGMLYQNLGQYGEAQILHPNVTAQIFTTEGALIKDHDHSLEAAFSLDFDESGYRNKKLYKFGFHYEPYTDTDGSKRHVPMMHGHSGTTAIFHANGIISIRFAKAWPLPSDEQDDKLSWDTIDIVNRLSR